MHKISNALFIIIIIGAFIIPKLSIFSSKISYSTDKTEDAYMSLIQEKYANYKVSGNVCYNDNQNVYTKVDNGSHIKDKYSF